MTLRVVSAGAAQGLVSALARAAGIEIAGHFGAVGTMLDRFRAGEACDLLILTRAQIEMLVKEARVLGETVTDLGSVATSIAVRADQEALVVDDPESLRIALLGADAIHITDPAKATAGIHFMKVLDQLDIRAAVEARLRVHPNGATAMRTMAAAQGRPIGCTQAAEILATPGVRLVAPLPRGLHLETLYTAAVNAAAASEGDARRFLNRLGSEASREERRRAGFAT